MYLKHSDIPHMRTTAEGLCLVASRHGPGKTPEFPPREFIAPDGSPPEEVLLGPLGVIYTFTVVHPGREVPPYALAMVDFEAQGTRAFGPLLLDEGQEPRIGATVRVVPSTLPDGTPDYAFKIEEDK